MSAIEIRMVKLNAKIKEKSDSFDKTGSLFLLVYMMIYAALISIISYMHEPWYDEAQTWVLSRDLSLYDMLFRIGHYEGHPALWMLYLRLFSKTGVPYVIGIKTASILIDLPAAYLIVKKAPFPKIFRIFIPFSYFLFYQYGVISRCYSITILGFVLCAIYWKTKDKQPLKEILAMMLTCLSSAYCIVLAFGMTAVWLYEIYIKEKNKIRNLRGSSSEQVSIKALIWNDVKGTFWSMFFLLAVVIFVGVQIIPYGNTYAYNLTAHNSYFYRLFYMIFVEPVDSLFFTAFSDDVYLTKFSAAPAVLGIGAMLFILFMIFLCSMPVSYGKRKLLIIPHLLFSIFCSSVFCAHHMGISAIYFIFWLWICYDSPDIEGYDKSKLGIYLRKEAASLFGFEWVIFALITGVQIYWTVSASVLDTRYNYYFTKDIYSFLSDNDLLSDKIMTGWEISKKSDGEETDCDTAGSMDDILKDGGEKDENIAGLWTPALSAYMDKDNNLYRDYNDDKPVNYAIHTILSDEEEKDTIGKWQEIGYPDIYIGAVDLSYIFDDDYVKEHGEIPQYIPVYKVKFSKIFKDYNFIADNDIDSMIVYMRYDLAQEKGINGVNLVYSTKEVAEN